MLVWLWPPEAEATWIFFGSECSSLFSVCLSCSWVSCSFWFCFNNLIWFLRSSISLSLSVDVCFAVEGTLVGDFPGGVVYELDVVIPAFSRVLVVLLGCLFCLFFSNVELLSWWCWCFPLRHLHKISWSLLELLPVFILLLVGVYILDKWTF